MGEPSSTSGDKEEGRVEVPRPRGTLLGREEAGAERRPCTGEDEQGRSGGHAPEGEGQGAAALRPRFDGEDQVASVSSRQRGRSWGRRRCAIASMGRTRWRQCLRVDGEEQGVAAADLVQGDSGAGNPNSGRASGGGSRPGQHCRQTKKAGDGGGVALETGDAPETGEAPETGRQGGARGREAVEEKDQHAAMVAGLRPARRIVR